MASVQDTTAIAALAKTNEPEAAFALGQTYNHGAVAALVPKLSSQSTIVQRETLEALGKVISKQDLKIFADSMQTEGLAWGYYRAGLRNVFDSTSVNRVTSILDDPTSGKMAHLGAAHFFARSQFKSTPMVAKVLNAVAEEIDDPEIRMAVVSSLAKLKPEDAIETVTKATDDPDYRVRVSSARALRTQPWDVSKPLFEKLLNDENVHVNVAAAEVLLGVAKDTTTLHAWAKAAKNWRTQATLYSKLKGVDKEVKSIYASSNNDYQKAALLSSLTDANFVFEQFKNTNSKVIKSSAASVLAHISTDLGIFKQIIADGDQECDHLCMRSFARHHARLQKIIKDYSFLEEAKSKLSLPRDYETYAPLEETLNYLKGLPPPKPLKNEFNHPIDWNQAASIAKRPTCAHQDFERRHYHATVC